MLGLPEHSPWRGTLGDLPYVFSGIIYGYSGNGKTEFCIQLMKMLTNYDDCAYISYEQGHGRDLQRAVERNNLTNLRHAITWINPHENLPEGVTPIQHLDAYLSKRSTPRFIFIDSVNYVKPTLAQFYELDRKHGQKRTMIWIGHSKSRNTPMPDTAVGQKIEFHTGFGIFVRDFIARPMKNRFGGFEEWVIYEELARQRDPLFFAIKQGLCGPDGKPIREPKRPARKKRKPSRASGTAKPKKEEASDE